MGFKAVILFCMAATLALCESSAWLDIPMWPRPQFFAEAGNNSAVISPHVAMNPTCISSAHLNRAYNRFVEETFTDQHTVTPYGKMHTRIFEIQVCMSSDNETLQMGTDESYSLSVSLDDISIQCSNVYGCIHAFTSLAQLIAYDFRIGAFTLERAPFNVIDYPRFPHRGLLIDTGRHWQPLRNIRRVIDGMRLNKLNVLHWHLTDWQAYSYLSEAYPQFADKGAFSKLEIYNALDMHAIAEYAKERGIRVVIEFDTPGHEGSMFAAMPEIFPDNGCKGVPSPHLYYYAFDFTKNKTYEVVETIWSELSKIFEDKFVHIGGDEVDMRCWESNKYIVDWCKARNWTINEGYLYYVERITKFIKDSGYSYIAWQEIWEHFGTKLPKDTIIHQWLPNSVTLPLNVTSHGYNLIWSDSSVWYLDHTDFLWEAMYDAEPCKGLNKTECGHILGGEGCMWGERVDGGDFFNTIFPRISAIAERLWAPREAMRTNMTTNRMEAMRCHMLTRGIQAAPVMNRIARQAPPSVAHARIGSCFRN